MVGTSFLMGAGIKLVSNVVNSWMHNSAEERRHNSGLDTDTLKAQVALAKEINRDVLGKISRMVIFIMICTTFCYITIYCLMNPTDTTILVENTAGFFTKFKSHAKESAITVHNAGYVFGKAFIIIEMVVGSYVVPSRRR